MYYHQTGYVHSCPHEKKSLAAKVQADNRYIPIPKLVSSGSLCQTPSSDQDAVVFFVPCIFLQLAKYEDHFCC